MKRERLKTFRKPQHVSDYSQIIKRRRAAMPRNQRTKIVQLSADYKHYRYVRVDNRSKNRQQRQERKQLQERR
jgi:hypothetical protein